VPGGRFVAELGGAGNVTTIVEAVQAHLRERGYEREHPWCFPTVGEYAATLEAGGFEVRLARLFDRPTWRGRTGSGTGWTCSATRCSRHWTTASAMRRSPPSRTGCDRPCTTKI